MFRNSELAERTRLAKLIFTILVDNVDYGKNAKEITLLTFAREHFNHHVLRRYKVFLFFTYSCLEGLELIRVRTSVFVFVCSFSMENPHRKAVSELCYT